MFNNLTYIPFVRFCASAASLSLLYTTNAKLGRVLDIHTSSNVPYRSNSFSISRLVMLLPNSVNKYISN